MRSASAASRDAAVASRRASSRATFAATAAASASLTVSGSLASSARAFVNAPSAASRALTARSSRSEAMVASVSNSRSRRLRATHIDPIILIGLRRLRSTLRGMKDPRLAEPRATFAAPCARKEYVGPACEPSAGPLEFPCRTASGRSPVGTPRPPRNLLEARVMANRVLRVSVGSSAYSHGLTRAGRDARR